MPDMAYLREYQNSYEEGIPACVAEPSNLIIQGKVCSITCFRLSTSIVISRKDKDEEEKTKHRIIGFDTVIKIDKTQVSGTKPELKDIHIPYYFESGFNLPDKIKQEIKTENKEIEEQIQPKKRGRPKKNVEDNKKNS